MLREGISRLLSSQTDFEVIGVAQDGVEAIALTRRHRPDVLLLEADLPRMTGLRVLELLHPTTTGTRVLLFGAAISVATAAEAVEVGVHGILDHDATPAMLFKSIRIVARGEYWLQRNLVGELLSHATMSSDPFDLTVREREIVELVVRGCSNKAIAERCRITADTVKHHLTSIFDKTGASTRVELAVFALHHGVATPAAPAPSTSDIRSSALLTSRRAPAHERDGLGARQDGPRKSVPVSTGTDRGASMAD